MRSLPVLTMLIALLPVAVSALPRHGDIVRLRMGLFIHWAGPAPNAGTGILFSNGNVARDVDEFADSIDVERVASAVADLRFEYVVLTDFHGLGTMLHPSSASDRWRGSGYAARRDAIGEMIAALKRRGIPVILFTHPLDGHDYGVDQKARLGWNDPAGGYRRWNDFINDIYAEITDRYGDDLLGIGFDSEFGQSGNAEWAAKLDLKRLRQTILSRRPGLNLIALAGPNDTCELGMKEIWRPSWHDPWMSRSETDYNVETWPAYRRVVGVVQGHHWATITRPADGEARLTADQLFRYTVLQAGTATEGPGVAWAASPYTDGTWERGVGEAFSGLARRVAPVSESLRGVLASSSFPTPEGATIAELPRGFVATTRPDGMREYIHVLKPPQERVLALPAPADNKRFRSAALVAGGRRVALSQTAAGVRLTLPDGAAWDPLDTVIRLDVAAASSPRRNLALHQAVSASSSVESGPNLQTRSDWGRVRLVDGQRHVTARTAEWSCGVAGWSSESGEADREEWVSVDLGALRSVARVTLSPRDDGVNAGYGLPVDFDVQVSIDGSRWTTVATMTDVALSADPVTLGFTARRARHVRVVGHRLRANPNDGGRSRMQFAEMEVYGPT